MLVDSSLTSSNKFFLLAVLLCALCNSVHNKSSVIFQKVLKNIKIICKLLFYKDFYFLLCVSVKLSYIVALLYQHHTSKQQQRTTPASSSAPHQRTQKGHTILSSLKKRDNVLYNKLMTHLTIKKPFKINDLSFWWRAWQVLASVLARKNRLKSMTCHKWHEWQGKNGTRGEFGKRKKKKESEK